MFHKKNILLLSYILKLSRSKGRCRSVHTAQREGFGQLTCIFWDKGVTLLIARRCFFLLFFVADCSLILCSTAYYESTDHHIISADIFYDRAEGL